jgi:hypothetical protein
MLTPEQIAERVRRVVARHKPLTDEELRDGLFQMALRHETTEENEAGMSICTAISILGELLKYRDRFGYIDLPVTAEEQEGREDD